MGRFFQLLFITPAFSDACQVSPAFDTLRVVVRQFLAASFLAFLAFGLTARAAFAALAMASGVLIQVAAAQLVPGVAVSFSGVNARPEIATQQVLAMGHSLDVGRVDTNRTAAQVVSLQGLRHNLDKQLVDQIRNDEAVAAVVHAPVTLVIEAALPVPARGSVMEMFRAYHDGGKDLSEHFSINRQPGRVCQHNLGV